MMKIFVLAVLSGMLLVIPLSAEAKTYYIHVLDMPKNWEDHFDHVLPQAKAFWANKILGAQFIEITNREAADFVIQWASEYQGTKLGYWNPSSDNELGKPYITITLGYMDDESVDWRDRKFNLVDPEYAVEITKHELGHALGFGHSNDPNDIMYPSVLNYDSWLSNKNRLQEVQGQKALVPILQIEINNLIENLKPQIYDMQDSLYAAEFSNLKAQKEKDNAWNSFGLAKGYFDNAESAQKKGERLTESNLVGSYWDFNHAKNELDKIQEPLDQANKYLIKAQELESEYQEKTKEESSNQTEEEQKFCFLFWCW